MRVTDVPEYLDELVDGYAWDTVDVVGFTSTFQQNTASIALARRLKQKFPHLVTLFGGANLEGEMGAELVRAIEVIDFAIAGEADAAFPDVLAALADGRDPGAVPGFCGDLHHRKTSSPTFSATPTRRLASLPWTTSPYPTTTSTSNGADTCPWGRREV